jgi:hypothetical protein
MNNEQARKIVNQIHKINMARAPRKESATDLIHNLVNEEIRKEIENMRVEIRNSVNHSLLTEEQKKIIDKMSQRYKKTSDAPTAHTLTNKTIFSGVTETNRYSDRYINEYQHNYGKLKPTSNVTKELPTISRTKDLDIRDFNDRTHYCYVSFEKKGVYKKQTWTKLVGKVDVEWWEFVLLYGIPKYFNMVVELEKNKNLINEPKHTEEELDKWVFNIVFKPKSNGQIEKRIENIDGSTYNVLYGTTYPHKVIQLSIPYNDTVNSREYVKNNLIYEERIDTLQPDYNQVIHNLNEELKKHNVPEEFNSIIAKELYGRLRGI